MRTNSNSSIGINQVFSSPVSIFNIIDILIEKSSQFHSFFAPLLAKLTMCNLTMNSLEMSQDWLAEQTGCCSRTIQRHLDVLVEIGFLKKKFRYHGKGKEQTNLYTLNPVAKSEEFLKILAKHFHEVRLYLTRTARERLRKAIDVASQKVILAKSSANQLIQKGVVPFKIMIYLFKNNSNNNNKEEISVNYSQKKNEFLMQRLTKLFNCSDEQILSLQRHTNEVLMYAEKAYIASGVSDRIASENRFRYFMGICRNRSRVLGQAPNSASVRELDLRVNRLSSENGSLPGKMKDVMSGENLKKAQQYHAKQQDALHEEMMIGEGERRYKEYLGDDEDTVSFQKGGSAAQYSSLNAQLSYRKHSGERPSFTPPIDIKKTMIEQFESGREIINNDFTQAIYAMFKQESEC